MLPINIYIYIYLYMYIFFESTLIFIYTYVFTQYILLYIHSVLYLHVHFLSLHYIYITISKNKKKRSFQLPLGSVPPDKWATSPLHCCLFLAWWLVGPPSPAPEYGRPLSLPISPENPAPFLSPRPTLTLGIPLVVLRLPPTPPMVSFQVGVGKKHTLHRRLAFYISGLFSSRILCISKWCVHGAVLFISESFQVKFYHLGLFDSER